jgi:hypothetical protein
MIWFNLASFARVHIIVRTEGLRGRVEIDAYMGIPDGANTKRRRNCARSTFGSDSGRTSFYRSI